MAHKYFLVYFVFFGGITPGKTTQGPIKSSSGKSIIDKGNQSPFPNRDRDIIYSDEGGRFFQCQIRYMISILDYTKQKKSHTASKIAKSINCYI